MVAGRITHYAIDLALISTVLAAIRRNAGYSINTKELPEGAPRNVATSYLQAGVSSHLNLYPAIKSLYEQNQLKANKLTSSSCDKNETQNMIERKKYLIMYQRTLTPPRIFIETPLMVLASHGVGVAQRVNLPHYRSYSLPNSWRDAFKQTNPQNTRHRFLHHVPKKKASNTPGIDLLFSELFSSKETSLVM